MKVNTLSLTITEADLFEVLTRLRPVSTDVKDLTARILPGALVLSGKYHAAFFWLDFSTEWSLKPSLNSSGVTAKLDVVKIQGVPAPGNVIENQIMDKLKEALAPYPYLGVDRDEVTFYPGKMTMLWNVGTQINVANVRVSAGEIRIDA